MQIPQSKLNAPGAEPFNRLAGEYDAWFDSAEGSPIFRQELAALQELMYDLPRPWLEVGVGTGRFAAALGFDAGVDPSLPALRLAQARGLDVRHAMAEKLPYRDKSQGTVLLTTAICFISDVSEALRECARVLRDEGRLIIGFVPAQSAWGKLYAAKRAQGHPFYSAARLFTPSEVKRLTRSYGFKLDCVRSTLLDPPQSPMIKNRRIYRSVRSEAGYAAMRFSRRKIMQATP